MDTVLIPPNATFPVEKARYVCRQVWDGGPFLSFARRRGLMRAIPQNLRQYIIPSANNDEEFTGGIHPIPQELKEEFVQNWLFFGLLAEVFCLNEIDTGERVVDVDTARVEINALYRDYVEEDNGVEYITGKRMLLLQTSALIRTRLHLAGPNIEHRIRHLGDCLKFSCTFINSPVHDDLDPSIKTSIAALGELISTGLVTATTFGFIPNAQVNFGFAWVGKYLKDSGDTERRMLENGWCRSEVERVRSVNKGLGTLNFLSRMRKGGPRRNHRSCSRLGCVALQLNDETYRPSHAREGCGCELNFVDEPEVQRILRETTTFPVLRVEDPSGSAGSGAGHVELRIQVEPYAAGTPYVAISHVWADGMGNPTANALPTCQIAKVAKLVNELEKAVNRSTGFTSTENNYRLWIDPLLCPIEPVGQTIALQRIPEVYRNATHVLVLDASLMEYAADTLSPAELLLRVFSSSTWMRRLWTLQEGALAQSLYFQFSDRPISLIDQMTRLFQEGIADSRYMRIWLDMTDETRHLRGWFGPLYSASGNTDNTGNTGNTGNAGSSVRSLVSLQRTLHYRTVSKAADEPICIATLMSLDLAYVLAVTEAQDRMVRVWELLARQLGGKLPARMLFSTDATLDVPGWRWAPRSLLGANYGTEDSMMDANFRMMRFRAFSMEEPGVENRGAEGVPTPCGLRVEMAGFFIRSVPLLPHLPLHPWARVAGSREDMLMVKHVPSGRWLLLMDFYRSDKSKMWTPEEMRLYDRKMDNPLCRLIDLGRRAILYDQEAGDAGLNFSLLARMEHGWDRGAGAGGEVGGRQTLIARRERMLIMEWASPAQTIVADGLQELAMKIAESEVTQQMLQEIDQVQNWDMGRETLSRVQEYMKTVMAEMWESNPTFVQAVHDTIGPNMEESMWVAIQMRFSHNLICEDVPRGQIWLID